MKKQTNHRIPTYIFVMAAVLGSWGIAFFKAVIASSYPLLSGASLPSTDLQYQYIFAFLFQ